MLGDFNVVMLIAVELPSERLGNLFYTLIRIFLSSDWLKWGHMACVISTISQEIFMLFLPGLELHILRGTPFQGHSTKEYHRSIGHQGQVRGHLWPWP